MKHFLSTIWQFIKGNSSRFIWELIAVAIGIGVTWLITQFTGQSKLQSCQDERAELLRENAQAQSFADSVKWSGVVSEKQVQINRLKNELIYFQEKEALDSAASLTEFETMRAINQRYQDQAKRR